MSAPIVEPAAELTHDERRRYARQILLPDVGEVGQRRLKAARVLVIGAGGLGSPALLYLAAAGVGTIGIVDDDVVTESNLHRQVVHGSADVGRAKVDSAADAVARSNPFVRVVGHGERLTADNAQELIAGYDLVVDGSDNFGTRYLVNDACVLTGTPWVWGAVLRFEGQVSVFWPGPGPTYRDLFPAPPEPGTVPSCSEAGVIGAVCAAVGAAMVTEAVKLITGAGQSLLGRVLVHDALAMTWRTLRLTPDPYGTPPTRIESVDADREPSDDLPEVDAGELAHRLRDHKADLVLVDVREPHEHAENSIPGSILVPLADVLADPGRFDPDQPLVLHCAGGVRSARALRAVLAAGHRDAAHLRGGIAAWGRLSHS
ncbi:adenylyltransferase/sulfurtransferase MoeZ [Kineosporia sp. NBRC 101677]|uniref:molybdopterin-synthase adenylyltransferase MoeB n=1 Tax=Kineosporia sp. NBRC 101677 TaxID=3032197 RepID=UPI0024A4A0E6|nr:molybdopterin-synthase adenylyltransferase MoeB [Kineosporia sp. NBRC 101677]GLY18802.1 adenylyltransferase/sulfurtransferase MoeZ [Kineosporia sp. NBRC 101677]